MRTGKLMFMVLTIRKCYTIIHHHKKYIRYFVHYCMFSRGAGEVEYNFSCNFFFLISLIFLIDSWSPDKFEMSRMVVFHPTCLNIRYALV